MWCVPRKQSEVQTPVPNEGVQDTSGGGGVGWGEGEVGSVR